MQRGLAGSTQVVLHPAAGIKSFQVLGPANSMVTVYAMDTARGTIVFYPSVANAGLPWGTTQVRGGRLHGAAEACGREAALHGGMRPSHRG